MSRKWLWSLLLFVLVPSLSALNVESRNLGLGIFVGGGITHGGIAGVHGKYWTSGTEAWDGAVSWGTGNNWNSINLQVDRLWHFFDLLQTSGDLGKIPLYAGFGGWLGGTSSKYWKENKEVRETSLGIGTRIPLGFSYLAKEAPLDAFLEVAPGLALWPSAEFTLDIVLGAHFYF